MVVYLTNIAQAFMPAALICGMLFALISPVPTRRMLVSVVWAIVAALALGWIIYAAAVTHGAEVVAKTVIRAAALVALMTAIVIAVFGRRLGKLHQSIIIVGTLSVSAILAAQAMFNVLSGTADHSFTATTVLNTELIVNSAAVAIGGALLVALVVFVAHIGRRIPATTMWDLTIAVGVLFFVWGGDVLLGALQLGFLDVTSGRVTFVAKVTHYGAYTSYVLLALLAMLACVFFWIKPPAADLDAELLGRAEQRKRRAFALAEMRWLNATLAVLTFLTAMLLYYDLYASQPPSLSKAEAAVPDADGVVKIPIDKVKDGKLYRFAYIASDGHRVRFFLINRYDEDHVKIGVVFDACMICGDDGYIQVGNEVICIACNVRVFVPSIGKPGGCNPIPMKHTVDAGDIVIAASELERGAKYFSEIVEITVTDPVTGNELINLKAPFQYDYKGNTFFFESRDSFEKFKADPEKYASDVRSRSYRVQGHQFGG